MTDEKEPIGESGEGLLDDLIREAEIEDSGIEYQSVNDQEKWERKEAEEKESSELRNLLAEKIMRLVGWGVRGVYGVEYPPEIIEEGAAKLAPCLESDHECPEWMKSIIGINKKYIIAAEFFGELGIKTYETLKTKPADDGGQSGKESSESESKTQE